MSRLRSTRKSDNGHIIISLILSLAIVFLAMHSVGLIKFSTFDPTAVAYVKSITFGTLNKPSQIGGYYHSAPWVYKTYTFLDDNGNFNTQKQISGASLWEVSQRSIKIDPDGQTSYAQNIEASIEFVKAEKISDTLTDYVYKIKIRVKPDRDASLEQQYLSGFITMIPSDYEALFTYSLTKVNFAVIMPFKEFTLFFRLCQTPVPGFGGGVSCSDIKTTYQIVGTDQVVFGVEMPEQVQSDIGFREGYVEREYRFRVVTTSYVPTATKTVWVTAGPATITITELQKTTVISTYTVILTSDKLVTVVDTITITQPGRTITTTVGKVVTVTDTVTATVTDTITETLPGTVVTTVAEGDVITVTEYSTVTGPGEYLLPPWILWLIIFALMIGLITTSAIAYKQKSMLQKRGVAK